MLSASEQISEWIHKQSQRGTIDQYRGRDWFQISPEEEAVFQIKPEEMPRLAAVYQAYESIKGMWNVLDETLNEQSRRELGLQANRTLSAVEFIHFASRFGVLARKANAMFYKMDFWTIRAGHVEFPDEGKIDQ